MNKVILAKDGNLRYASIFLIAYTWSLNSIFWILVISYIYVFHSRRSKGIVRLPKTNAWGFGIVNKTERQVPDLPNARRGIECLRRQALLRVLFIGAQTTPGDHSLLDSRHVLTGTTLRLCGFDYDDWEANSRSAGREITRLLWNSKVHYRVHSSPLLVTSSSQMNPICILSIYFYKNHYNPPNSISISFVQLITRIRSSPCACITFCYKLFFLRRRIVPRLLGQADVPPLVGCLRLPIQYIRRYLPYLKVVSLLGTRHAVVTIN
jgi:hypothetical protein